MTQLEAKASTLFATVGDTFSNTLKIDGANTTAVYGTGYVRGVGVNAWYETFQSKDSIDISASTNNIDVQSGNLRLSNKSYGTYVSEPFSLNGNVTSVNLMANFTTSTETFVFSNEPTIITSITGNATDELHRSFVASNGTVWRAYLNPSTGLWLQTGTGAANNRVNYLYTQTFDANNIKNIAMAANVSANVLFVAYPTTNIAYNIDAFDLETGVRLTGGSQTITTTGQMNGIDMVFAGGQLYVLFAGSANASATRSLGLRQFTFSPNTLTLVGSTRFLAQPTDSISFLMVSLAYDPGTNNVFFAGFRRNGNTNTTSIWAGLFTPGDTISTISPASTSTRLCSGMGYVGQDGYVYMLRSNYVNFENINYVSSMSAATYLQSATIIGITASTLFLSGFNERAIFADSTNGSLYEISAFDNTSQQLIYSGAAGSVLRPSVQKVISGDFLISFELLSGGNAKFATIQEGVIQTRVKATFLRENQSTTSSSLYLTSGTQHTFSVSPTLSGSGLTQKSTLRLKLDFDFPNELYKENVYTSLVDLVSVQDANDAANTPTTATFTSTTLKNDRLIDAVYLEATTKNENASGNSIQFKLTTPRGDISLTKNAWTTISPEVSSFGLKAILNKSASSTLPTQLPEMNSYNLTVRDTLTVTDLLPLQINLLKMGLNVTALTISNTTDYKNMMIDLFNETSIASAASSILNIGGCTLNGGAITNNTGNFATVTSKVEDTDINKAVSTILMLAEGTATNVYKVRKRNAETWKNVTLGSYVSLLEDGDPDTIQIQAVLAPGAQLFGWAYLYA